MAETPAYDKVRIGKEDLTRLGTFLARGVSGAPPGGEDVSRAFPGVELLNIRPGTVIVKEGEKGSDVYFVHTGSVLVVRAKPGSSGREVARLGEGEVFGEIALLEHVLRTATVLAAGETVIFRVPADEFGRFLARHPQYAESLRKMARTRLKLLGEI